MKAKAKGLEAALGPGLDSSDIAASRLLLDKGLSRDLVQDDKFKEWKSQVGLFLDNAGVWRCKGRLDNANLSASTMHPILLPNRHHFVSLQLLDCHRRVMHGDVKETLTELLMSFWIVKGQSVVKGLHANAQSVHDSMDEQIVLRSPFQCQSFGYENVCHSPTLGWTMLHGPLYVKEKQVEVKVWIALFTCAISRALHLQLVPDIAFLRCFKRFAARRGTPLNIVSDNSKTLKSVNRELLYIQSDPVIKNFFSQIHIQWCFNVEKIPWWDGFFERLNQSVKNWL